MIKMQTNYGTIFIELDTEKAPETCANFEQYVKMVFMMVLFSTVSLMVS